MIHGDSRGDVELITIDRQEKRNAVDAEALNGLADALEAALDRGARAVVLTGAGGHFCAGADLSGVEDEGFFEGLGRALQGLITIPVPVIAAVSGAALGAGTQLAVACDLRVAVADARFGIPAAKLGLMVDQWTVQRLALLAGHGPARAMLLAADEVSGEQAYGLGLVQRLGDLDSALEWAGHIANLAPLTIAGHKLSINRLEGFADDVDAADAFKRVWTSADLVEGRNAFAERRKPQFRGE
jgi:enoyl-CoA hydratase